ncbi:hypothetical protein CTI12_AA429390 [Artemisia annua]|uniref:BED-type domain-containing protein n=1 Tax=Artemisia annua TaxID=35608 RepID=A0A2U1M1Y2_ARTAN|nr:hypothetical protein CTI12_AA429390 [Artemisia annua]
MCTQETNIKVTAKGNGVDDLAYTSPRHTFDYVTPSPPHVSEQPLDDPLMEPNIEPTFTSIFECHDEPSTSHIQRRKKRRQYLNKADPVVDPVVRLDSANTCINLSTDQPSAKVDSAATSGVPSDTTPITIPTDLPKDSLLFLLLLTKENQSCLNQLFHLGKSPKRELELEELSAKVAADLSAQELAAESRRQEELRLSEIMARRIHENLNRPDSAVLSRSGMQAKRLKFTEVADAPKVVSTEPVVPPVSNPLVASTEAHTTDTLGGFIQVPISSPSASQPSVLPKAHLSADESEKLDSTDPSHPPTDDVPASSTGADDKESSPASTPGKRQKRIARKRKSDDTIVEETPILNIDESDSGDNNEPSVVVTQAQKAQRSKRKRNGDKEEEYEIYARTNSERASIWQHFDPVRVKKNGLRRALCKFCNKTIAASGSNGTSGLHKRYPCPSNPKYESKNKVQQQTHLEFKKNSNGEGTSSLQTWKHDESRIKKALINMFVVGEIPFKFVEHEAFVEYTNACNGRFMLPSRHKLSRDVSKWNSKHDMLKIACSLREVFFKYELEDDCYYRDLERMSEHLDFGVCEGIVEFLEKFKTKTKLIPSSSKPLAHLFYREILDIDKHLRYWATKPEFCHMVDDMVKKYNRYWGKFDELNDYMYFATLLDPTMKQQLISHGFKKMLEYNMSSESPLSDDAFNAMVREMLKKVVNRMGVLFQTYKTRFDTVVSKSSSKKTKDKQSCKSYVGENDFLDDFLNLEDSGSIEMDTELTRYLGNPNNHCCIGVGF